MSITLAPDGQEAWERLPTETAKAFAAFQVYRDQDPYERSARKVAKMFGKTQHAMDSWASRHQWVRRAAAWDAYSDQVRVRAQRKAIEQMADRQARMGVLMQVKGAKRIQDLSDDEIAVLSLWEAMRLVTEGGRLERIARGEAPDMPIMLQANQVFQLGPHVLGDIPLVDLLRRHPERVGAVVTALQSLRTAMPELAGDEDVIVPPQPGGSYDIEESQDIQIVD